MATTKTSKDRRWRRFPIDVRVKILVSAEAGEAVVHGRSRSISEGGIGVTLTRELSKGTLVTLVFRLPEQTVDQTFQAELAYRTGFSSGFEFRGLLPGQREQLRLYCASAKERREKP